MIDCLASQPNYWRHLAPVVEELERRGREVRCWATRQGRSWGPVWAPSRAQPAGLALCASWLDARRLSRRRCVYLEHGAGQTYLDAAEGGRCYAGAPGLEHVELFLAPGEPTAERWRAAYPAARAAAIGCPALDQHFGRKVPTRPRDSGAGGTTSATSVTSAAPLVAVTCHWRCGVCPETMPALPEYERALSAFRSTESGIRILGHAHPRAARRTAELWARLGIPFEPDPDALLEALHNSCNALLVADNTSLLYEAAALGIPTLSLNSPSYRRDVEHGLRFWSHVPGLQCDLPTEFRAQVEAALADPPAARALRQRAVSHVYAARDGSSAARAADAIEELL